MGSSVLEHETPSPSPSDSCYFCRLKAFSSSTIIPGSSPSLLDLSGRRTEYNRDQTQERSTALGSRKVQGDRESEEEWSLDQSCGRKAGGVLLRTDLQLRPNSTSAILQ